MFQRPISVVLALGLLAAPIVLTGCDPAPPVTNPSAPSQPANPPAGSPSGAGSPGAPTSH